MIRSSNFNNPSIIVGDSPSSLFVLESLPGVKCGVTVGFLLRLELINPITGALSASVESSYSIRTP